MITRYNPVERFRAFDRFNQMMDEMFANTPNLELTAPWSPLVDVKETEKELTFIVELPGVAEKDIDVEVVENRLTITGKREMNVEEKKEDYVRIERSYGTFMRTFNLDWPVKPELIKANFKDGVLRVTVPKAAVPQPKKVLVHKT